MASGSDGRGRSRSVSGSEGRGNSVSGTDGRSSSSSGGGGDGGDVDSRDLFRWVGATIDGKYSVERVVGAGGFGVVYQAQHRTLGPVAVKCLKLGHLTDEQRGRFLELFLAEGKHLRSLSSASAGIVQAFDAGETTSPSGDWSPYLVLEWLTGRTLAQDIDDRRRSHGLAPARRLDEAIALLEPAADALDVAHGQGIAHRDIKPENLFIANVAGTWTVKVLDFGIAKVMGNIGDLSVGAATTGIAMRAFSPTYAAPEQFNPVLGATGPWTDVYALALVLVEVASGRRAYRSTRVDEQYREASDQERRPSFSSVGVNVSPAIERVMLQALAVDPRNRFARVGDFWKALCDGVKNQAQYEAARPVITEVAAVPNTSPRTETSATPLQPVATTSPVTVRLQQSLQKHHGFIPAQAPPTPPTRRHRVIPLWVYALGATAIIMLLGAFVVGYQLRTSHRNEESMASIAAGQYVVGSPSGDPRRCEGARTIQGEAFLIDRTEVTVADYASCVRAGRCTSTKENAKRNSPPLSKKDYKGLELCNELRAERGEKVEAHPINCVDRNQASIYCAYVGKRLPSDDEWERAARGPDGTEYPWGNHAPIARATTSLVTTTRFVLSACGSVRDEQLGREWYVGPDEDMSWDRAITWVESLNACGLNWQPPSIQQLATLFDAHHTAGRGFQMNGQHYPAKIDPLFSAIGGGSWVWSKKPEGSDRAWAYNFFTNGPVVVAKNGAVPNSPNAAMRAFAVHDGVSAPSVGVASTDCTKAVFQRAPTYSQGDRCPGPEGTAPVRSMPASASFGLFDMAGNVWEWTSSSCSLAVPYGAPTRVASQDPQDPQQDEIARQLQKAQGKETGTLRGGGHEWSVDNLRAWKRLPWPSDHAGISTGFRCAKDPT